MIENPRITAPIPGQSLTGEPRQYAWERPPEYDTPEEALKFYLPKITDDETVDDIHLVLESGFPLSTLVKGIYMNGVMDGLHSIDVGTNQIEFKEVPVSETERLEEKERRRLELSVERFLEQTKDEDEGTQFVMGATQAAQQDMPVQEEMPQQEEQPSGGLMSRSE
jgi:hypothetical protein